MAAYQSGISLCLALLLPVAASAQTPDQRDNAVKFGAIATIGPICGLRDGKWAADLRRAELQAMGAQIEPGQADPAQRRRSDRAGAILSYAEDEALEGFAETTPEAGCARLAHDPDLARADTMVAAFRAGTSQPVW